MRQRKYIRVRSFHFQSLFVFCTNGNSELCHWTRTHEACLNVYHDRRTWWKKGAGTRLVGARNLFPRRENYMAFTCGCDTSSVPTVFPDVILEARHDLQFFFQIRFLFFFKANILREMCCLWTSTHLVLKGHVLPSSAENKRKRACYHAMSEAPYLLDLRNFTRCWWHQVKDQMKEDST